MVYPGIQEKLGRRNCNMPMVAEESERAGRCLWRRFYLMEVYNQ
jgi:hypothetical protein